MDLEMKSIFSQWRRRRGEMPSILEAWFSVNRSIGIRLVIKIALARCGDAKPRVIITYAELVYLRDFRKRNSLPYGFAVADSDTDEFNYGVFSIPTSFLIDRKGVVRYISLGADEKEVAVLGEMIKKLLEEK